MNVKIASISQGFEQRCPGCKAEDETLIYVLKDYPTYWAMLSIGGWDMIMFSKKYSCYIDWLEDMGVVKINFDTIVGANRIGYGTTVKDDEGNVLGGGEACIEMMITVEEGECYAFRASIKLACQLHIKGDVPFKTDHASLINNLRNQSTGVTITVM
ncbi:hypothetical protein PVK06_005066 [Gossypium arboreum]|uniref:RNase H type-1 domain-containing protein n=1 Tax=Gossypium arboreum TaxID=29729 RepID=A0ABR0QTP8_GOSAR|nr:hypothetical protein PVK06_005066 [Gossypium arboreum]